MTPAEADAELGRYLPGDDEQAALLVGLRHQLAAHPGAPVPGFEGSALHRDGPAEHLTVTSFVVDEDGERAVLVLHRKAGMWLQPGGHVEAGDPSLAAAALREASEETGLGAVLRPALGGAPLDVQRHELSAGFGRACRAHLDVAFLFTAPGGADPVASDESERVAWFAVDALPAGAAPDLPARLSRARRVLRR